MGLNDAIKNAVDSVTDKVNEVRHNANADAEATKRDVAGDALTPGEKLGSMANEAKERAQAGIAGAKQDVRENT